MIVLLPNRREIDTMHALRDLGLSITTVSSTKRMLNVAHERASNVIPIRGNPFARPRVQDYFNFGDRPQ